MSSATRPSIHIQAIPQGDDTQDPSSPITPLSPFEKDPLQPTLSNDQVTLQVKDNATKPTLACIDSTQPNSKSTISSNNEVASPILPNLRIHFIRKVLTILFLQLGITGFCIGITFIDTGIREFMSTNIPLLLISFACCLGSMIFLICNNDACRKVPRNYIVLFSFTFSMAYLLGSLAASTESEIILYAGLSTFLVVASVLVYALMTKEDLTRKGTVMMMLAVLVIKVVVVAFIFKGHMVIVMWSVFMVMTFGFYLAFVIQKLMGEYEEKYSVDDYVIAAMEIYVTIVQIFLIMIDLLKRLLQ